MQYINPNVFKTSIFCKDTPVASAFVSVKPTEDTVVM